MYICTVISYSIKKLSVMTTSKTFVPSRDVVASHFNNGGKIEIKWATGSTTLDKFGIGKMFGVNPDSFSLAEVCKNGFGDKGPITLSVEIV